VPRYFTHYWANKESESHPDGEPIAFIWGSQFSKRNLAAGDVVFGITVDKGTLNVLVRLVISEVIQKPFKTGHERAYAEPGSLVKRMVVPAEITRKLEFLDRAGRKSGLKWKSHSKLDQQTLRAFRELTSASAKLVNDSWLD
jgi:hypothetical protein